MFPCSFIKEHPRFGWYFAWGISLVPIFQMHCSWLRKQSNRPGPTSADFWICISLSPAPEPGNFLFHNVAFKKQGSHYRHILSEGLSWIHLGSWSSSRPNQLRCWVGIDHRMPFLGTNKSATQFDLLATPELSVYHGEKQHIRTGINIWDPEKPSTSALTKYPLYPCWISLVKTWEVVSSPHLVAFFLSSSLSLPTPCAQYISWTDKSISGEYQFTLSGVSFALVLPDMSICYIAYYLGIQPL